MNNLYKKNLEITKKDLKEAITKDFIIVQTIHTIDELIKIESKILANLRERIGYYAPRASRIEDSGELIKEISLLKQEDFGIDFTKDDLDSVKELIKITNAPKFGIIFSHESITTAVEKGKASRKLASEISKAVRIDYYGKFI